MSDNMVFSITVDTLNVLKKYLNVLTSTLLDNTEGGGLGG